MEIELKKLAAAMRDMSDMVGDHHWQAAKAIEQLAQLREELAQRDAEVERLSTTNKCLIHNHNLHVERIAALESQQAASVGGEREVCEFHGDDSTACYQYSGGPCCMPGKARAALSPTGGGVAANDFAGLSQEAASTVRGMVEYCLNQRVCLGMDEGFKSFEPEVEHDFVKELHAFAQANSQEGE